MDVNFFLRQRTAFIRSYFDHAVGGFREIKTWIEEGTAPFDDPPIEEDGEPAYLAEWIDADTGFEVVAQSCVSLLSDTLKLYFNTLRTQVIGFSFDKREKVLLKKGFVAAYRAVLGDILDTDWSDCPARFDVIEQVVLARNLSQHGGRLTSFRIAHDRHSLKGRSNPLFADEAEWRTWQENGGEDSFFMPAVAITREALFAAIDEVERLANWIDGRLDRAHVWRSRQVPEEPEAEIFGLLSAARSALDLCVDALTLFGERRPEVIDQGDSTGLMIDGRRMERSLQGPLTQRGMLGAQAFLSNLVVVENCVARLATLAGLPPQIKTNATTALKAIRAVVDRQVRNTTEHIDERVTSRADQGLISSSIFEPDMLCSTRLDGSVGAVSITQETLDAVAQALDSIIWTPEELAAFARPRSGL